MATSKLSAVIDRLVALFNSALGSDVKVIDGPLIDGGTAPKFVAVGFVDDTDPEAGTVSQTWAGLGAMSKDEEGEVHCLAVTQSGTTKVKPLRDECDAIIEDIESALRGAVDLDGLVNWAGVSAGRLRQRQTAQGLIVEREFQIAYRARI